MTNPGGRETARKGAGSILCFQLLLNSEGELGYSEHFLKGKENLTNANSQSLHGKQPETPPCSEGVQSNGKVPSPVPGQPVRGLSACEQNPSSFDYCQTTTELISS